MDLNTITEVVQPRRQEDVPTWQDGDAWLGGGTWLFSEPQPRLRRLIDLASLGWPAIGIDERGLHLAATCTIAKLQATALPAGWTAAPLISQCCRAFQASFKIWNTATVGGNLCLALPAGPVISLAVALDGVCTIWSRDGRERRLPAAQFVTGAQQHALAPGELLRQIELPASALVKRTAFRQLSLTPLGRSAALLIGALSPRDKTFDLTITAATSRPFGLSFTHVPTADQLRDRIEQISDTAYFDDVHGAPDWRKHITTLLAEEIRQELSGGPRS
jgi:CO/xanthine dehydrogenase FAD-binding subunit